MRSLSARREKTARPRPDRNAATCRGDSAGSIQQDGIAGFSNELSVVVSGLASDVGSPPSGLTAVFDDVDTVTLDWTNNSGTGSNIIERALYGGSFEYVDSVSDSTITYDDTVVPDNFNRTYVYRISNESVAGYFNEAIVYVPRADPV